jgi:hypothetical protein
MPKRIATVITLILGLIALCAVQAVSDLPALAADCAKAAPTRLACLNQKVANLEAKLAGRPGLLKWNDRIAVNEDMRLFLLSRQSG